VRDEAKMKGGIGICGRELCCSTFLHDFSPVTLKMAKTQMLPLSPNKLSGLCGRLRCCLAYEHEAYQRILIRMPRVGARVETRSGRGVVRKLDLLRGRATVSIEDSGDTVLLSPDEMSWESRQDLPRGRSRQPRRACRRDPSKGN
jgi:cell fate regulator YaaT (PSP1 superfamily)